MKPKIIFIEYLNRDNNFTVDKIYFDNYEDAKAWGKNNLGELGLGETTNRSSPVQIGSKTTWTIISGNTPTGRTFAALG
jgi:hypothetical protein